MLLAHLKMLGASVLVFDASRRNGHMPRYGVINGVDAENDGRVYVSIFNHSRWDVFEAGYPPISDPMLSEGESYAIVSAADVRNRPADAGSRWVVLYEDYVKWRAADDRRKAKELAELPAPSAKGDEKNGPPVA